MSTQVSEKSIRKAARRATTVYELASIAGYSSDHRPGSGTRNRIRNVIGNECYQEIASGFRKTLKKKYWSTPQ